MNLSDSEEGSSSDEGQSVPKRARTDTYGASSATSQGSNSDEELETPSYSQGNVRGLNYNEISHKSGIRLSRSSLSENCSSPNDRYDDYRPSFDENDDNKNYQDNHDKNSDHDSAGETLNGYPSKIKQMMNTMGYIPGKGLGKLEDGRTEPVEAFSQKGLRGLGFSGSVLGDLPKDYKYEVDNKMPECEEKVSWIPSASLGPLSSDELEDWLKKGPKKLIIDDETNFVAPEILSGVLNAKNIFNTVHEEEFRRARFRSNPFETIGSAIFLNRAAVKMANLDAVFDNMFTRPLTPDNKSFVNKKHEVLYFADVCAGPGGFSEYMLYKQKWNAKGFGFTLKGQNDFKLSDFYAGTSETFNPYYGVEEDGDIFNPANLTSLKNAVLKNTDDKGVHVLMADGGFSVEGQENIQEILSKQLYLCQCLAALMLVRTGGNFLVKLFDIFTPFSVGLIYIMYRCFDNVSIHKPVTSRPANSERYLVCKWKRMLTEPVENHLYSVNAWLWKNKSSSLDVLELVPVSYMQQDKQFFEYIYNSNCLIGENQIRNLYKIAEFYKDEKLTDDNQSTVRTECLKLWRIPDEVRKKPKRVHIDETFTSLLNSLAARLTKQYNPQAFKSNVLNKQSLMLETSQDLSIFKNVFTWHFVFLSSSNNKRDVRFLLGHGGKEVYQLEGTRWQSAVDLNLTLPAKTLIYAEIVKELNDKVKMHNKAVHVIDAAMLGGVDISCLPLSQRLHECSLFCTALAKPFENPPLTLRCKRLHNMENFADAMNNLEIRNTKFSKNAVTYTVPNRNKDCEIFHIVGSILFIKETVDSWQAKMSRSAGVKYWYSKGKNSEFNIPPEAAQDMFSCFTSRITWMWDSAERIFQNLTHNGLTRSEVENYVHNNINEIKMQ